MEYKIQEFKPHDYQKFAADFIMTHPISAVILFLGAGKTVITLTAIEKLMYELGPDYSVRIVTDDRLLQFSAVHSGIFRMTTKEFIEELTRIGNEITEFVRKLAECKN